MNFIELIVNILLIVSFGGLIVTMAVVFPILFKILKKMLDEILDE